VWHNVTGITLIAPEGFPDAILHCANFCLATWVVILLPDATLIATNLFLAHQLIVFLFCCCKNQNNPTA